MKRIVYTSELLPRSVCLQRPNVEATVEVYYNFSGLPVVGLELSPNRLSAFTNEEVLEIAEELKQAALLALAIEADQKVVDSDTVDLIDSLSDSDIAFVEGRDGDY